MNILFVCWGNICRSPVAHAIMQQLVNEKNLNWKIKSAGTQADSSSSDADPRMRSVAAHNGLIYSHKPRQFEQSDLDEYDLILVSDEKREFDVLMLTKNKEQQTKVKLLRSFVDDGKNIPDPYYEGDFEGVYELIKKCCERVLEEYI
jgi:protein-tyrosine phosphatase